MGRPVAAALEEDGARQLIAAAAQVAEVQKGASQDSQVLLLLALLRRPAQETRARAVVRRGREDAEDEGALPLRLFAVPLRVLLPRRAPLFHQPRNSAKTHQVAQKI